MKSTKNDRHTTNFIKELARNPSTEPVAAFTAVLESDLLKPISPMSAPRKGPIKIPKGIGERIPIISPIVVPMAPALLPPKRLVPAAGMI